MIENICLANDLKDNPKLEVKCIRRYNKKFGDKETVILEVDPFTHRLLINREFVFIGHQKLKCYDHVNIRRCGKCLRFSHGTQDCKLDKLCFKCGSNEHNVESCEQEMKCINCCDRNKKYGEAIDIKHNVFDINCPTYCNVVKSVKRRTYTLQ